eukprot:1138415-Pelagomonas_calceolata.AAC.7
MAVGCKPRRRAVLHAWWQRRFIDQAQGCHAHEEGIRGTGLRYTLTAGPQCAGWQQRTHEKAQG